MIALAIIAAITMNIVAFGQQITIEKGLPITFVAQKKSYTVEKCEMTYSPERFIAFEIFGEGFEIGSLDKTGRFPMSCSYTSKGKEYFFDVVNAKKTSIEFFISRAVLPYPESITLYPKGGKKVKIKIE